MTKGLTYKAGSLELTITTKGDGKAALNFEFQTDYKLTENQSGFVLKFTESGLEKVKKLFKQLRTLRVKLQLMVTQ